MADGKLISTKQLKIDKANATILYTVAICSFIFVFSIIASKSLIAKYSYQNRIRNAILASQAQVNNDQNNVNKLDASYTKFTSETTNVIGGQSSGQGIGTGANDKIIQDALPAVYDFPALVSSLQSLVSVPNADIQSISGTDESTQLATPTTPAAGASTLVPASSAPTPIQFTISVNGSYSTLQTVIGNLQHSVRPISIENITLSGTVQSMQMSIIAETYYLPPSGLSVSTETVQ